MCRYTAKALMLDVDGAKVVSNLIRVDDSGDPDVPSILREPSWKNHGEVFC